MATTEQPNPNLIELGHPDYDAIYQRYYLERGKQIHFNGSVWRVVKDSGYIKFSRIDSGSFDNLYGSNSMPGS